MKVVILCIHFLRLILPYFTLHICISTTQHIKQSMYKAWWCTRNYCIKLVKRPSKKLSLSHGALFESSILYHWMFQKQVNTHLFLGL